MDLSWIILEAVQRGSGVNAADNDVDGEDGVRRLDNTRLNSRGGRVGIDRDDRQREGRSVGDESDDQRAVRHEVSNRHHLSSGISKIHANDSTPFAAPVVKDFGPSGLEILVSPA